MIVVHTKYGYFNTRMSLKGHYINLRLAIFNNNNFIKVPG